MKAAAIYCRVSTQGQARDGTSLDTQADGCVAYAQAQGMTVATVIKDDVSGAQLDRPGLDSIRDMAERGDIQTVVVFDPDRLSRNLGHLMLLIEEFDRKKVELVFVNAPHENTPEGMMLLQMRGMFAQYERTKTRERSRRGKERRAKDGHVIVTWAAPYGYATVKGEGRFEILEAEALWVARIFDWYVNEGASIRSITRRLDETGVPTKRGAPYWSPSTVRAILTNETYKGQWHYNKNEAVIAKKRRFVNGPEPRQQKSSTTLKARDQWVSVAVPPIISEELFDLAAPQIERNKRNATRNCKTDYLLRGLLICKQCGRRLTGRRQPTGKNKVMYSHYYCTGRYEEGLRDACRTLWPNSERLDARVWEQIASLLSDEETIANTLKNHEQVRRDERKREDAELGALHSSEQKLKGEEDRFLDAYAKGIIDIDQLQGRMTSIRQQKDALQKVRAELDERTQQREMVKAKEATIRLMVARAKQGLHMVSFEDKRAFLEGWGVQAVVDGETDTLTITGFIRDIPMSLSGKLDAAPSLLQLSTHQGVVLGEQRRPSTRAMQSGVDLLWRPRRPLGTVTARQEKSMTS